MPIERETIVLRSDREAENKRRYLEIQDFIRRNALTYQSLGEAIGYSAQALKQYMHKLKNGRNASRYIWRNIQVYTEVIAHEKANRQPEHLS